MLLSEQHGRISVHSPTAEIAILMCNISAQAQWESNEETAIAGPLYNEVKGVTLAEKDENLFSELDNLDKKLLAEGKVLVPSLLERFAGLAQMRVINHLRRILGKMTPSQLDVKDSLWAVEICSAAEIPIPSWAANELIVVREKVNSLEHKDWKSILGPLRKRHEKTPNVKKRMEIKRKIRGDMFRLTILNGLPVTKALERLVKEYASNKTTIHDIYYEMKAEERDESSRFED